MSVVWSNRVFLAIASAVIFTLPHLGNPEAIAYKVFKRNEASEPVSQSYRKGRR